ncbi:hypothetical protein LOTGIDRAFT_216894 [Lottia gigantea]|uniref:GPS domain-containing protein n=1 Tax=Lottia gigantea TaxID=225164 RepID=V4AG56_LOTGI|nr:hypothetical protein LOTGIDRAFT_216894 [Lottia gigantea]ESO92386.1 hypothetical protein LOTGIDRAFT_216894 [Lottia gigantea]
MTHYQISDILQDKQTPEDSKDDTDNVVEPEIVSYVISASLGGADHVKLPEPISFTLKHKQTFPQNAVPLCSFLNLSEGVVGIWSQEGCKLVKTDDSSTTCQCDHLTNFAILMDVKGVEMSVIHSSLLRYITLVGCIISIICLLLCFITFNCFSAIQGERNSIHKNLVFCLFVAEILFLVGIDKTENKLTCGLIAGFLHYFFLTAFTWMFLEGLYIICMLVQVFDAAKSRLPYYYFVGYGFPLAIVAVSAGIYHQGYGTDRYCWLTTENYFIWSFAGPIAVVLLVSVFDIGFAPALSISHLVRLIQKHYSLVNTNLCSCRIHSIRCCYRAWIQGAIAIEVILGLTWIFGYCFISQETIALAYIFTVLNSLQGLFIFCFHCLLNKKVSSILISGHGSQEYG